MAPTTSRPWPPPSTADRARRSVGERLPRLSTPCCDPVRLVLRRPIESGQYASKPYRAVLARHGITQSMSRKGDCYGRVGGWRGGFAPRWGYGVAFAPPPQSGSAGLRLQPPLVEPEVRISRIRLPLETSGLRARRVDVRSRQLVQAEGLVEVGLGIAAVSRPLSAAPARQPALQPPFGVPADQIVDPRDRPLAEVGGPAPQERVERRDPTFGRGRVPPARRQVVDPSWQAPDRLLGRGGAEIRPAAPPVGPADPGSPCGKGRCRDKAGRPARGTGRSCSRGSRSAPRAARRAGSCGRSPPARAAPSSAAWPASLPRPCRAGSR